MRGTAGSKGSTMGFLTFIQLSSKEAGGLQLPLLHGVLLPTTPRHHHFLPSWG